MSYAVTPTLWVGSTVPDVSGPKVLMPDGVSDSDSMADAIRLIAVDGVTLIVPHENDAAAILRELGLGTDEINDRLSVGQRSEL